MVWLKVVLLLLYALNIANAEDYSKHGMCLT